MRSIQCVDIISNEARRQGRDISNSSSPFLKQPVAFSLYHSLARAVDLGKAVGPPHLLHIALKYIILCRIQIGLIRFTLSRTRDPLCVSLDWSRLCARCGSSRDTNVKSNFICPNGKHIYTLNCSLSPIQHKPA